MNKTVSRGQEIFDRLKQGILNGKYVPGREFPSIVQLMRRFEVSRVTAVRVTEALKKAGLVVSRQGRGTFVTRRARLLGGAIGLIVPGICYSEVFPLICQEISRLAQKAGLTLLFGDISSRDPGVRAARAFELAKKFAKENISGVIYQPMEFLENAGEVNQRILSVFDEAGIPVVLIDNDIVRSPNRSSYELVSVNSFEVGRRLAEHLIDQGARSLCFLMQPNAAYSIQSRLTGVKSLCAERRAKVTVSNADVSDLPAVRRLFGRRPAPDAIICRNDHLAAHLLLTLRKLGKGVPRDVRVTGCNDASYAAILEPSLTTVRMPCADIAATAFRFLTERIADPSLPIRECYLKAEVVCRASTAK